MRRTLYSLLLSSCARHIAVVVFPTPPFWFATAIFTPSVALISSPLYTFHSAAIKPNEKMADIISATYVRRTDTILSVVIVYEKYP